MARRRKSRNGFLRLIGGLCVLAGLSAAAYGGITYFNLQDALGNRLTKVITGTTEAEKQALIFLISGGAGLILGLGLVIKGRR